MCYRSLAPPGVVIPDVALPLSVAVMLKDGRQRSTAMHAPVLAPRDVRVYEHPDYAGLPEFDAESCVVAFPSDDAVPWTALDGLARVRTLILIDSPWQQAQKALALPQLAGLRRVKIDKPPAQVQFWRVAAHTIRPATCRPSRRWRFCSKSTPRRRAQISIRTRCSSSSR